MGQWSFITKIIKDAKKAGDTENAKQLLKTVQHLRKNPENGTHLERLANMRKAFDKEFSNYDPDILRFTGKTDAERFNNFDKGEVYSFFEHPSQYSKEFDGYKETTIDDMLRYYRAIRDAKDLIKNEKAYNKFVDKDYINFINELKTRLSNNNNNNPRQIARDILLDKGYPRFESDTGNNEMFPFNY